MPSSSMWLGRETLNFVNWVQIRVKAQVRRIPIEVRCLRCIPDCYGSLVYGYYISLSKIGSEFDSRMGRQERIGNMKRILYLLFFVLLLLMTFLMTPRRQVEVVIPTATVTVTSTLTITPLPTETPLPTGTASLPTPVVDVGPVQPLYGVITADAHPAKVCTDEPTYKTPSFEFPSGIVIPKGNIIYFVKVYGNWALLQDGMWIRGDMLHNTNDC
jgi:hypothetical protein